MRSGASDEEIAALVRRNVAGKWEGHEINSAKFVAPPRPMYSIGGEGEFVEGEGREATGREWVAARRKSPAPVGNRLNARRLDNINRRPPRGEELGVEAVGPPTLGSRGVGRRQLAVGGTPNALDIAAALDEQS